MDCISPGFPVLHYLLEFAQTHVHWVGDAIQSSHHLLPASAPALSLFHNGIFSSELAVHIRWPKYWSFSVSINPSNEYSGLISFRIDWFDFLAVQGTLKSLAKLNCDTSHNKVLCSNKSEQVQLHLQIWTNLTNIMLSKRAESWRCTHYINPFR